MLGASILALLLNPAVEGSMAVAPVSCEIL